jgi:hypothetical protein
MSKTTGKLKYDLALSSTTLYDASSIYINKSAELSLNGNANLQYKSIGPTYSDNGALLTNQLTENGGTPLTGKAYLYIRNLGPTGTMGATGSGAPVRIAMMSKENNEKVKVSDQDYVGQLAQYDQGQFSELNPGEFTFMPIAINIPAGSKSSETNLYVRSAFDPIPGEYLPGETVNDWLGSRYNDIEYAIILTDHNPGPAFGGSLPFPGDPGDDFPA